jgi:hypothetical protein
MSEPLLVDVAWLERHLEDPAVRIFDATVQLVRPAEGGPYEVVSGRRERARRRAAGLEGGRL